MDLLLMQKITDTGTNFAEECKFLFNKISQTFRTGDKN